MYMHVHMRVHLCCLKMGKHELPLGVVKALAVVERPSLSLQGGFLSRSKNICLKGRVCSPPPEFGETGALL